MPIRKSVNRSFFKIWSSNMAYVLGFFAADGTMVSTTRGGYYIEFHVTDREVLEKIKNVLKSSHKISTRDRGVKEWKLGYRLQIGSKEMFSDLLKLGFMPNKSNMMIFPKIPKEFLADFVRGYFDGDGCIYFKKHYAKDRDKFRWVFQTRFTCGSKKFLESLHKILNFKGGFITNKNRGYELIFSHRDSVALYQLMYHNSGHGLFLERKYKLFRKALKTLYKI